MLGRAVMNGLRRVEPQPVKMKLIDPVSRVRNDQLAHRWRALPVEVQGVAPFVVVRLAEIGGRIVAHD